MCGVINWVSHLGRTLSFGHRLAILSNGRSGWLDDQIVNYSCALISDAFPHVFGFRPTTLFACSAKNIQREVPALRQRMLDPVLSHRDKSRLSTLTETTGSSLRIFTTNLKTMSCYTTACRLHQTQPYGTRSLLFFDCPLKALSWSGQR